MTLTARKLRFGSCFKLNNVSDKTRKTRLVCQGHSIFPYECFLSNFRCWPYTVQNSTCFACLNIWMTNLLTEWSACTPREELRSDQNLAIKLSSFAFSVCNMMHKLKKLQIILKCQSFKLMVADAGENTGRNTPKKMPIGAFRFYFPSSEVLVQSRKTMIFRRRH